MSTRYELFQGPGRQELLHAIDRKKTLHFRGRNEAGHSHLFEVFVTSIDLIDMGRDGGNWRANGIIVTKNGQDLNPSGRYRASYNSQRRKGEFEEIIGAKDHSLEYFQGMNDAQLTLKIKWNQDNMPLMVRELEDFTSNLSNHERLALLAFHTHLLFDACIAPKIHHQLNIAVRKIRAERSGRPVRV